MKEILTVMIPVYNAMPFLPLAIDSILKQQMQNIKVVIIDDGSSDGSTDYLKELNDPRIDIVIQTNKGLGYTLNLGLALCETPYFARMDADDISLPTRLYEQIKFLKANHSAVMVGTQVNFLIEEKIRPARRMPLTHDGILRVLMEGRPGVCHPTIVFKSEIARRIGGYRLDGAGEDIDFCIRMCEAGQAFNLRDVLYYYRLHPNSLSLGKMSEVHLGYMYALECARARLHNRHEPTFESFLVRWESRSYIRKSLDLIHMWSGTQYRKGIISLSHGRLLSGYSRLLLSAICRPKTAIWRLIERLSCMDK